MLPRLFAWNHAMSLQYGSTREAMALVIIEVRRVFTTTLKLGTSRIHTTRRATFILWETNAVCAGTILIGQHRSRIGVIGLTASTILGEVRAQKATPFDVEDHKACAPRSSFALLSTLLSADLTKGVPEIQRPVVGPITILPWHGRHIPDSASNLFGLLVITQPATRK